MDKAADFLRKKGLVTAAKKAGRTAASGVVHSYIHSGGKIGVLVEINCETDFVAKTDEFQAFVNDMGMQIAAMNPRWLTPDEVPADGRWRRSGRSGRPRARERQAGEVIPKIVEGQIKKWYTEVCLLDQPFVKENKKDIRTPGHRARGHAWARTARSGASCAGRSVRGSRSRRRTTPRRSRSSPQASGWSAGDVTSPTIRFERVLLKLSGEALEGGRATAGSTPRCCRASRRRSRSSASSACRWRW